MQLKFKYWNMEKSENKISDTVTVLKYSQADVNRMQDEWKREFQARLLVKEGEWLKKLEAKDEEKNSLNDMVNKTKHSNAQLKRKVAECERKIVEIMAEKSVKKVLEETRLTQLEHQVLAPDSVKRTHSTTGEDTYRQSEDIDVCPVTRVKCEKDLCDKNDSNMTTDWEMCLGDTVKEVFSASCTDRAQEWGQHVVPKEELDDETESEVKPYSCPLCGESYATLSRLHCHQILHHRGVVAHKAHLPNVKPYTCKICYAAFTHKTGLLSHERFHSRVTSIHAATNSNGPKHQGMCVEPEKSVSGATQSSALSSREKGGLNSVSNSFGILNYRERSVEMPYACSICKARFTHKCGLASHERIHVSTSGGGRHHSVIYHSSPPYACTVCNKKFSTKSDLRIHELSHATKKPFSCIKCGESYIDFGSFQHHKVSCLHAKAYPCSFCNKSFFSSKGQKAHELLHTDVKKFFCDVCGESFARKKALNRHELIHTRTMPY